MTLGRQFGFATIALFAALAVIGAPPAHAAGELAHEKPDLQNPGRCVIVGPSSSPRWKDTPGIDQNDLNLFDKADGNWARLVQRYREGALRVGPSTSPRLVKSDDCGFMKSLARALNDGFYAMPTMECTGGNYVYRYRPIGSAIEIETIQISRGPQGESQRRISQEWAALTATASTNGCQIRVTLAYPKSSQFKMCLQSLEGGPARVAMLVNGRNLPREAMSIRCTAEPTFAATAQNFVRRGSAVHPPSHGQPADAGDNPYVH